MAIVSDIHGGVMGNMPCIFGELLTGCTGDILMG